jgi:hypothetical protein
MLEDETFRDFYTKMSDLRISSREKGRPIMQLSMMSHQKKKLLLKINF